MFEFASVHGVGRWADGVDDEFEVGGFAVVDGEGDGLVAIEFPGEAFEAFAGDAFATVFFGSEADMAGRDLVVGKALFLEGGTGAIERGGGAAFEIFAGG